LRAKKPALELVRSHHAAVCAEVAEGGIGPSASSRCLAVA